ncbi:MAG: dihydroorotase, partial [Halieaceae bacterium]
MKTLTIAKPDDWHIHLRDGNALPRTVNDVAGWAQRAIVMPNLVPPVLDAAAAMAYRQRILAARQPQHQHFEPLMILYLSDKTTIEDVTEAATSPHIHGIKLYPAGATTNSEAGVNDLTYLYPVFEAMEKHNLPLLIHGEVTDSDIDIFDREKIFIDRFLSKLVTDFPGLRVVFEHITTTDAVEFVAEARDGVAATVTAHHLLYNRNDLLVGGVRPHYFCLPILKRNSHQESLRKAVIS